MATRSTTRSAVPARAAPNEGVVLTKATVRAAEQLGLPQKVLARIIGVSEAGVSRMSKGAWQLDRSAGKAFELAVLFVRLYRSLDAIAGGDRAVASAWMTNVNTALAGKPVDLVQSVAGLLNVINYLDARRAHI